MIRLWPQSLYGRLTIILISGLVLTQLITVAIHWRDRGRAIHRVAGLQFAHRIVEITQRFDTLSDPERRRIIRRISRPQLQIHLRPDFGLLPPQRQDHPTYSRLVEELLRQKLGRARQLQILVSDQPLGVNDGGHGRPHGPLSPPRLGAHAPLFFLARMQLADGAALDFVFRLPRGSLTAPGRLVLWIAVLLISALLLAWLAVRQTTKPLAMMVHAAEDLGRDINRPPLSERGPGEVRRVARAFNQMQGQIKRYVDDRTRLLAAVSHDLKTPITRMRIRAEMLADDSVKEKFESDLKDMETMVAETLDFMRGVDSSEGMQSQDMVALIGSLCDEKRCTVELLSPRVEPFTGRPLALKRCLANLIDNAINYGGSVHITLLDTAAELRIELLDDGPGIAETQLERVFDPFYRLEKSRSKVTGGTGLGLSIARTIARAHGGEITLHNRDQGGLCATLVLPRSVSS